MFPLEGHFSFLPQKTLVTACLEIEFQKKNNTSAIMQLTLEKNDLIFYSSFYNSISAIKNANQ